MLCHFLQPARHFRVHLVPEDTGEFRVCIRGGNVQHANARRIRCPLHDGQADQILLYTSIQPHRSRDSASDTLSTHPPTHLLVCRKSVLDKTLDFGVDRLGVNGYERVVHPALGLRVPLVDCLPQAFDLVELLLGLGKFLVTAFREIGARVCEDHGMETPDSAWVASPRHTLRGGCSDDELRVTSPVDGDPEESLVRRVLLRQRVDCPKFLLDAIQFG